MFLWGVQEKEKDRKGEKEKKKKKSVSIKWSGSGTGRRTPQPKWPNPGLRLIIISWAFAEAFGRTSVLGQIHKRLPEYFPFLPFNFLVSSFCCAVSWKSFSSFFCWYHQTAAEHLEPLVMMGESRVNDADTDSVILEHNEDHHPSPPAAASLLLPDTNTTDDTGIHLLTNKKKKKKIKRCKTAPAMAIRQPVHKDKDPMPLPRDSTCLVGQAALLLLIYLTLGVVIYFFNRDHFSGVETHPLVDALYFCIVTMCTIGYGDIAPTSPATKVFSCVFVLVGFGFIDILLSGVLNYVLDLQENMILSGGIKANNKSSLNYIVDVAKGRMRIRLKVGLALGVVVVCIGIGTFVLHWVERLNWVDSAYLSVMSVTTVGYGDRAFKTLFGRLFASIWLLLSTLAVARAFLYLAEARVDKRHRRMSNWVLHRTITIEDLFAADLNNTGFLSKSEYIIFKLKEMGKIGEKDIRQICSQFNKLDSKSSGKITLPDLLADPL